MRIATLALLLLSGCQGTYVAGMGGTQRWPDTNNSDDVEAATDPGWMAGVAAGQRLAFDGWHLRLEGELAHRQNDVHGRNNPRVSGIDALGEEIDVTSLLVNAWPGWRRTREPLCRRGARGRARRYLRRG